MTSGFAHALHTVQPGEMGAMQYGHTDWRGWARLQNGHIAESSSTRFPQNRHGFLYPTIKHLGTNEGLGEHRATLLPPQHPLC
jgi:hypothetical protein